MNSTCQQVASCSITNPGSSSRGVVAIGSANAEINHQYGYHDAIGATVSDASASCAFPWTSPYAGKFEVHEFHPTGCCMEGTISVTRRFTLAAGATATYYLNARTTYSESTPATSDYLQSATLQCILVQ